MSRPKLEVAGLWTCRIRSTATRAEPAVVLMCRCPSRSWMTRMSTPCQAGGGRKSHRESQTEQIGKASGSRRAARGRAVGGTPTCGRGTGAQAARGDGARQSGGDLPARGGSARRAEVHQGPEQSTGRPQASAGGAHLRAAASQRDRGAGENRKARARRTGAGPSSSARHAGGIKEVRGAASERGSKAKPPADRGSKAKPPADRGSKAKPPAGRGSKAKPPAGQAGRVEAAAAGPPGSADGAGAPFRWRWRWQHGRCWVLIGRRARKVHKGENG